MISCIIIDDEEPAMEVVRNFCKKIPYLDVIGTFSDPLEAVSFIDLYADKIDLVFLDIEMPRFSGIDFLKAYRFAHVILVTAYTDYALSSYEYAVADYLHKPFSFDRFSMAVTKVYERQQKSKGTSNDNKKEESEALYLKIERKKYIKLAYTEIKYIEGAKNFTIIKTLKEEIVTSLRLKELEQLLPANRFLRIHKCHIINMDHFESLDGNSIRLKATDERLQLGATYGQDFLKYISKGYP